MDDRATRTTWAVVCIVAILAIAGLVATAVGRDDPTVGLDVAAATSRIEAPTTTIAPTTTVPPTTAAPATTAPPTTTEPAPAPEPTPADDGRAEAERVDEPPAAPSLDCLVRLHGKGGAGAAPSRQGETTVLAPTGNAAGWGGRQWRYESGAEYAAARAIVASAIDEAGCTRVNIGGFSNGAAFAAALACRGESFGGRLARVIVDDPVTDHAVEGCRRASGVTVTLYWTGALAAQAQPGWDCASADWTCAGGTTIGVTAYAAALGTEVKQSPMGGHTPYADAPELFRF